jgi:IS5 family transposase
MKFCEFELHETVPDYSSLNRFRNKLIQRKFDEKLFDEINRQLEILDLKVQKAQAAIIDATIELLHNPFLSVILSKFIWGPQIHQEFC